MDDAFTNLAAIYDAVMRGVPYGHWVATVRRLARERGCPLRRVLDVGCGTGAAALRLACTGVEVVGVDASAAMITEARRKAGGLPVRFEVARMEELDLGQSFDAAVSLFDSVNYVIDPGALQEAFRRIHAHLVPGGLWMFDMNTPYALEMELFTQDNLATGDEPKYEWRSRYDPKTRLATVKMRFYVREHGAISTLRETHVQRAYTLEEVDAMLGEAGFAVLDVYDAYTDLPPLAVSDRALFVARREA